MNEKLKEQIQKLKDLELAHEIALNYDYVPYDEQLEDVMDFLVEGLTLDVEVEKVEFILTEYGGYSVDNIESKVFSIISDIEL